AVAVAFKHVNEEPIPPSRLVPETPSSIEAVALRAMAKDPAARYGSAGEMASDLWRASGIGLPDTEPWGPPESDAAPTALLPAAPPAERYVPGWRRLWPGAALAV